MERIFASRLSLIFTLLTLMAFTGHTAASGKVKVELLSPYWSFATSQNATSALSASTPGLTLPQPGDIEKGFTIRFSVNTDNITADKCILEIPEVLNVSLRRHDPKERKAQNYPAFKMADGSVPVLEASLSLQSRFDNGEVKKLIVGVPLTMLDKPKGEHEVVLNFSGVRWTMYVDGRLVDNDFALGYPLADKVTKWNLNPACVKKADIYFPAIEPVRVQAPYPQIASDIQYWTPADHNAWVGDVVSFFHKGRYHIFYLFDRRGHASKFGMGAHYFEHLSTADFKTWTEHEAATPIEHQWETFGTGTPFVYNGELCISYGLHTTRIYPKEETTLPFLWADFEKNGHTGSFNYNTLQGVPAGSTYSISQDGVTNFKKTHILYHPCENPSIYTDPAGNLKMLANYGAKGTWGSDSVNGGWKCENPDFPLGGDCTFFFRWGKYDYIIGGFTRLWSKPANAPESAYKDVVSEGLDFYNGYSVPAITEIPGGRFLMAAWLKMQNWGGPLVINELVQHPDGRIGTKWMEEIVPATKKPVVAASAVSGTKMVATHSDSFMLTFEVVPGKASQKNGRVSVVCLPREGETGACEWQLQTSAARSQFADGSMAAFAGNEKTLREGGAPQAAGNYAIENLSGIDKPFTVRMIVKGSDKFGGSVIDAEIAGQSTMLTYRPELYVGNLLLRAEGATLRNVKIAPLAN